MTIGAEVDGCALLELNFAALLMCRREFRLTERLTNSQTNRGRECVSYVFFRCKMLLRRLSGSEVFIFFVKLSYPAFLNFENYYQFGM